MGGKRSKFPLGLGRGITTHVELRHMLSSRLLLYLLLLLLLLRDNSLNKIGLLLLASLDIRVERLCFRVARLWSLGCS